MQLVNFHDETTFVQTICVDTVKYIVYNYYDIFLYIGVTGNL